MFVQRHVCPECGTSRVREKCKSLKDPSLSIMLCELCTHMWKPKAGEAVASRAVARVCTKCGSAHLRLVGRSASGMTYIRCTRCEHLDATPSTAA